MYYVDHRLSFNPQWLSNPQPGHNTICKRINNIVKNIYAYIAVLLKEHFIKISQRLLVALSHIDTSCRYKLPSYDNRKNINMQLHLVTIIIGYYSDGFSKADEELTRTIITVSKSRVRLTIDFEQSASVA